MRVKSHPLRHGSDLKSLEVSNKEGEHENCCLGAGGPGKVTACGDDGA